jgi:hypothetical protein
MRAVQERLFSAGERLGWEFRDRLHGWRHFDEPEPRPAVPNPSLHERFRMAAARHRGALGWAAAGAALALLAGWYDFSTLSSGGVGPAAVVAMAALTAAAAVAVGWLVVRRPLRLAREAHEARHDLAAAQAQATARSEQALAVWRAAHDAHNAAEWERVNRVPEWGAVRTLPGTRRIDVFGGSLQTWEAFLTTFGASMIAEAPPVRVLDLSEGTVAEELCRLAEATGHPVARQVLPEQLAASELLAGLGPREVADLLVESIHGGRREADREARAMDARILTAVCQAVAADLSLARVSEALVALLGEQQGPVQLSRAEWDEVRELFSPEYVRQAHDRFRVLEAHVHPLRNLRSASAARSAAPADLHCLMVDGGDQVFATDLFQDLAVQWALRAVRTEAPGTLIVAGADRLPLRHLERLADACERQQVRLVYLFRHLRDDATRLLGSGGVAVFMRLGNHEEAERAAQFIGRGHRFVLSQVTRGHGASQAHRSGTTQEESTSTSRRQAGSVLGPLDATRTRSRSWGVTNSYAEGTNWHYAETHRRVQEYLVEPAVLQNLPDYALLVVQQGQGTLELSAAAPRIQVADCNPDILTLPRVLTEPLPQGELPEGREARVGELMPPTRD